MAEKVTARRRGSANRDRVRRLLVGGALGGHIGLFLAVGAFLIFDSPRAAAWAAIAGAVTILFFVIGHAVQVAFADADPKAVLVATMASYIIRVTALGMVLAVVLANADGFASMHRVAVAVATISVVVTWLAAEIATYARLRVPIYDEPSDQP